MNLDVRTVVCLLALSSFLTGLGLFAVAAAFPEHVRGIRRWAWACGMHAGGWTLVALRGEISDALSIVGANTLLSAALVANFHSIVEFLHLRFSVRPLYFSLILVVAALSFWTFAVPDTGARILVMSGCGTIFLGVSGALFLFPSRRFRFPASKIQLAMMLGFWACSIGSAVRVVHTVSKPPPPSLFVTDWGSGWFFAGVFVEISMLTFGFVLMCSGQILDEWKRLATIDPLTGIWNRAAIEKAARHVLEAAQRSGVPFSIVLCDIDYFKSINDTLGHEGGDRALQLVVTKLQGLLRAGDMMGRVGGEEFLIVAPDTSAPDVLHLAERLRVAASGMELKNTGGAISLTVSFGVAQKSAEDADFAALFRRADIALYRAKAEGRNRVCAAETSCYS